LFKKQLGVSLRWENCACAGYLKEPKLPAHSISFIIFPQASPVGFFMNGEKEEVSGPHRILH